MVGIDVMGSQMMNNCLGKVSCRMVASQVFGQSLLVLEHHSDRLRDLISKTRKTQVPQHHH